MNARQFSRLVANVKADGCLTSLPLVYRNAEGALEVISGNHRVRAAIEAGLEEGDVLEVTSPLTRQQFVALQLSHNAIVGQDDMSQLLALYDELDFQWKERSGLTDDAFKLAELVLPALSIATPEYEEIRLSFLPADRDVFSKWLAELSKPKGPAAQIEHYVGRLEDFAVFFDAMTKVKKAKNVHNSAIALRLMAELAIAAIAEDAEPVTQEAGADSTDAGAAAAI